MEEAAPSQPKPEVEGIFGINTTGNYQHIFQGAYAPIFKFNTTIADSIVTTGGGRIVFDSPDSLHYLAIKGNIVYLVEEKIR